MQHLFNISKFVLQVINRLLCKWGIIIKLLNIIGIITIPLILIFCKNEENIIPPLENDKIVSLISPNGGEKYSIGDSLKVLWESENVDLLDIFISFDNRSSWVSLAKDFDAKIGNYALELGNIVSDLDFIKIVVVEDSTIFDISDNPFQVVQETEFNSDFFPLTVGNILVYQVEKSSYPNWQLETWKEKTIIAGQVLYNGVEYYDFLTQNSKGEESHKYFHLDDISGTIYEYNDYAPNSDYHIANLSFVDGVYNWTSGSGVNVSTFEEVIFNEIIEVKEFDYSGPFSSWKYKFANEIGIVFENSLDEYNVIKKEIQGAVIENIVLGDTSFTSNTTSLPEDSLKYYPLKLGDYWIYSDTLQSWGNVDKICKIKREIISEQMIDGKLFIKIQESSSVDTGDTKTYYERISEDGKIYMSDGNSVNIIDDLATEVNNKNYFFRYGFYEAWTSYNEFVSYSNININNFNYISRNYFTNGGFEFDAEYSLLYTYGLYSYRVRNGNESSFRKGKLIGGKREGNLWGKISFP